jgi:hypothetical protein
VLGDDEGLTIPSVYPHTRRAGADVDPERHRERGVEVEVATAGRPPCVVARAAELAAIVQVVRVDVSAQVVGTPRETSMVVSGNLISPWSGKPLPLASSTVVSHVAGVWKDRRCPSLIVVCHQGWSVSSVRGGPPEGST